MSSAVRRDEPPLVADECTSLPLWLDYHRATLLQKCEGLSGTQLVLKSVPPSTMTLLGLVRHMTVVEWWWFEHVFVDGPSPEPFSDPNDPDADFNALHPERAEDDVAMFRQQCAHSRSIVDGAASLNARSLSSEKDTRDLRWIVVHMIEEYARHNGHADLLRECVDGAVGE
jgi:hypothetical protein